MPQDGAFLSWLILAEQSADYTLSDGLLVRVQVDGTPISFDKYMQDIRQQMLDDGWIDPAQTATGMNFIDWTDGSLGNTVLASSLQTRFQVINVTGANLDDLLISTRRVFAPAAQANSTPMRWILLISAFALLWLLLRKGSFGSVAVADQDETMPDQSTNPGTADYGSPSIASRKRSTSLRAASIRTPGTW